VIRSFRRPLTLALLGSLLLPPMAVISSLHSVGQNSSPGGKLKIACYCLLAAGSVLVLLISARRFGPSLAEESVRQGEFLDLLDSSLVPLGIVIAAGLSLFLELAVIRWQASMFEFFAFYKNFGLLACFAGL